MTTAGGFGILKSKLESKMESLRPASEKCNVLFQQLDATRIPEVKVGGMVIQKEDFDSVISNLADNLQIAGDFQGRQTIFDKLMEMKLIQIGTALLGAASVQARVRDANGHLPCAEHHIVSLACWDQGVLDAKGMRFSRCVQNKKLNEDPISEGFGVCCWGHDSPEDPSDMPMCARKMEGVSDNQMRKMKHAHHQSEKRRKRVRPSRPPRTTRAPRTRNPERVKSRAERRRVRNQRRQAKSEGGRKNRGQKRGQKQQADMVRSVAGDSGVHAAFAVPIPVETTQPPPPRSTRPPRVVKGVKKHYKSEVRGMEDKQVGLLDMANLFAAQNAANAEA